MDELHVLHSEIDETGGVVDSSLFEEDAETFEVLTGLVALDVLLEFGLGAATLHHLHSVAALTLYGYLGPAGSI